MSFMRNIFNFIRNVLAVIGLCSIITGAFAVFVVARSYNLPPRLFALKALEKYGLAQSSLAEWVKPDPVRPAGLELPNLNVPGWKGYGARSDRNIEPIVYDSNGRPVPFAWKSYGVKVQTPLEPKRYLAVATSAELISAIRNAVAGDSIVLLPGVYPISERSIEVMSSGTSAHPIMVRAERLGDAVVEMNTNEGFWLHGAYWIFENLDIKGITKDDDYGEHAFHIVGGGIGFVLRNCQVHEFNAMVKANGNKNREGEIVFPDGALIEGNSFYNSRIRDTANPVTFIDVVGPNGWIIRGNLIADFAKGQGDRISYAAFLKGNSSDGVFENNLVIGEYRTTGGVRVGLSLGGGGSGAQFSRGGTNSIEHSGGMVRNNIVMYCSDVGLYLNKARDTKVFHNTFFRTAGIDIRFPQSSAIIQNNLLTGRILERDGGVSLNDHNIVGTPKKFSSWFEKPEVGDFRLRSGDEFVDKGTLTGHVNEDFYGNHRDKSPDIGAIEYDRMKTGGAVPVLGN